MGIILAIFVFSVLVIFHEMGHFLIAKKNGIGVTEFSIGMGPRLFSFVKGGTRYSLKLIMFGGSCAMVGNDMFEAEYQKDDEEEEESIEGIKDEREDSFNNKS
ncbi:MAG: site-2 protease family protein, partial [Lachnospiraceae bacterium]|nr:site-2 protease family protein [Lachnospiraceae bacterium]